MPVDVSVPRLPTVQLLVCKGNDVLVGDDGAARERLDAELHSTDEESLVLLVPQASPRSGTPIRTATARSPVIQDGLCRWRVMWRATIEQERVVLLPFNSASSKVRNLSLDGVPGSTPGHTPTGLSFPGTLFHSTQSSATAAVPAIYEKCYVPILGRY